MMIIGIAGQRHAGKDTLANFFEEDHNFRHLKMSAYLKNMLRSLLKDGGYDAETIERCIEGDLKEEPLDLLCGKSIRDAMISLGTEWRDTIHTELWTSLTFNHIKTLHAKGISRFVISDIRFPHEVNMVHALGGIVVRLIRPGYGNNIDHASENQIATLNCDWDIVNNQALDDLRAHAMELLPLISR